MPAGPPTAPILKASAQDFTCDLDLSREEVAYLLDLATQVKAFPAPYADALRGRSLSLLFEKPSLRTRLTFELAMKQLGGDSILNNGIIGEREPLQDVARNLDRWTQGIVARVFSQATVDGLARWSRVPVINALSDLYHPCQALADMLTLRSTSAGWPASNLSFVGDGNNVAHSLMLSAVRLGVNFTLATPPGYLASPDVVAQAAALAETSGAKLKLTTMSRKRPSPAPTRSIPMSGPAWAPSTRPTRAARPSGPTRSPRPCSPWPRRMPSSCTASRRTGAKRSPTKSSNRPNRRSSIRPRIDFTLRRLCY